MHSDFRSIIFAAVDFYVDPVATMRAGGAVQL